MAIQGNNTSGINMQRLNFQDTTGTGETFTDEIITEDIGSTGRGNNTISRANMTSFLEQVQMIQEGVGEATGDIPITDIEGLTIEANTGNAFNALGAPRVLPASPQFAVPNNPLLPPQYSEILDYNSLQYMNGVFRTQIGKYVKVNQLVGSNNIQEHDGFLIGVGINYIVLQEYDNNNIMFIDFYGIKNMYTYYEEISNPFVME